MFAIKTDAKTITAKFSRRDQSVYSPSAGKSAVITAAIGSAVAALPAGLTFKLKKNGVTSVVGNSGVLSANTSVNLIPGNAKIIVEAGAEAIISAPNSLLSFENLGTPASGASVLCYARNPASSTLICGTLQGIFRSTNGGESWTLNAPAFVTSVPRLAACIAGVFFIYTSSTTAYTSTDDGVTWANTSSIVNGPVYSNYSARIVQCGFTYACAAGTTASTTIITTTDGITWTSKTAFPSSGTGNGLAWSGSNIVVTSNSATGIYYSSDLGATWAYVSTGFTAQIGCMAASNGAGVVIYGTAANGCFISSDSGLTWAQLPVIPTNAAVQNVRFGGGQGFLINSATTIYRSLDISGSSWTVACTTTEAGNIAFSEFANSRWLGIYASNFARSTDAILSQTYGADFVLSILEVS